MEIVLVERYILCCAGIFLVPVITLGMHLPVLSAQTAHKSELAEFEVCGEIEGVDVHVIDEPVEVDMVFIGRIIPVRVYRVKHVRLLPGVV